MDLFIYLFIIIIILWVLACGFNWVCLVSCFYGTNVGFELGGGVQYGYDCVVWLLCIYVSMNCSNVGQKRETDGARERRDRSE